jgi:hypothetical protein
VLLSTISKTAIALPVALDDNAGTSGTGGSLTTATPNALHFAIVIGYVASSILAGPYHERVSCILTLPLAIHRGHV